MYLKDVLNNKELKINIRHNHELSVEVYTYDYEDEKFSALYFELKHLYKRLCEKERIKLFNLNKSVEDHRIKSFNFVSLDESKLEIKPENRMKYNLKRF